MPPFMLHVPGLYIANSEKGRGVYVSHTLQPGETIEVCPVIVMPPPEIELVNRTRLFEYYFLWPDAEDSICLALGYGSLYNHSKRPNARVIMSIDTMEIIFESIQDIAAGDEILIDYLDGAKPGHKLWFTAVE